MRFKDNTAPVVPEAAPAREFELELPSPVHDVSFDEGVLLRLNQSAMRRLDSLVREGIGTASGVDAVEVEVGGILIGAVARDRSMVTLVDVAPIKLDRRSGPGFRPSEIDLRSFADAISQESKGLRHVIGYFRSELDAADTVSLRTEDENLLRRFFADGFCTFVLAGAARDQPVTASICNWKTGEEVRVVERLQLVTTPVANPVRVPNPVPVEAPVQARIPSVGPQPVPAPVSRPAPKPTRVAALPKLEPDPPVVPPPFLRPQTYPGFEDFGRESSLQRFKKPLIAGAAAIFLLVAFGLGRFSAPRKPVPDPRLDLNVEVHDLIAEVKWDPSTPVIRDSERAALDIVDGADVSRIDLNPAQVRAGHYVFVPQKPDLTFVMTVYRKQNAFVGATRKVHLDLGQTSNPSEPPAQASLLKPASTPAPATPSKQIDAQKTGGGKSEIKTGAFDPAVKPSDKAVPDPARPPSFTPPPRVARNTPTPSLEDAPALATPKSSPAASPLPVTAILSANSAFIPGSSGEAGTQSPAAGSASSAFSQAVPIKRVSPIAPLAGTLTIRQEVSIRVSMLVDQYGQVTEAHALDVEDVMKRTLAPLALEAARRWQFDPARKAGVPVPSQTIVIFQFAKNL